MQLKEWWQDITERILPLTRQSPPEPSHPVDIPSVSSESGGARFLLESPLMLFSNPEQLKNSRTFLHEFTHSYQTSVFFPHFLLNQEILLFYFLKQLAKLEKPEEGKLKSRSGEVRKHFRDLETKLNEFKSFERDYLFTPDPVANQGNLSEKDELRLDFFLEGWALAKEQENLLLLKEEGQKRVLSTYQLLRVGDKLKRKWRKSSPLHRESFAFFEEHRKKITDKLIKETPRELFVKSLRGNKVVHLKGPLPPYLIGVLYPFIGAAALAPPRAEKITSQLQKGELPTLKPQLDRLKKLWSEPDNLIDEERLHNNLNLAQENTINWVKFMMALQGYTEKEKTLKQLPKLLKFHTLVLPLVSLEFFQYEAFLSTSTFQRLAINESKQEFTQDFENCPSPHKVEEKFFSKAYGALSHSDLGFPDFFKEIGLGELATSMPLVTIQSSESKEDGKGDHGPLFLASELAHWLVKIKRPRIDEDAPHLPSDKDLSRLFFEHFLLVRMAKKAPQMITGENLEGEKIPYPIECPAHELGENFVERCSQNNFGEDSGKRCKISRNIEGEFDAEQEFAEETCPFWQVFNQSGMGKINYQWK